MPNYEMHHLQRSILYFCISPYKNFEQKKTHGNFITVLKQTIFIGINIIKVFKGVYQTTSNSL